MCFLPFMAIRPRCRGASRRGGAGRPGAARRPWRGLYMRWHPATKCWRVERGYWMLAHMYVYFGILDWTGSQPRPPPSFESPQSSSTETTQPARCRRSRSDFHAPIPSAEDAQIVEVGRQPDRCRPRPVCHPRGRPRRPASARARRGRSLSGLLRGRDGQDRRFDRRGAYRARIAKHVGSIILTR